MKYLAPMLVLYSMVCLTDPQGFAVWIDRQQVVSVSRSVDCAPAANAKISTGNGTFLCVRETVQQAVAKFDPK